MLNKVIDARNLPLIPTNHQSGLKKVLIYNGSNSVLPQVAIGFLESYEYIPAHVHNNMNEYFYIQNGSCIFTIDNQDFVVSIDQFIVVPYSKIHSIKTNKEAVQFLYWGVVEK